MKTRHGRFVGICESVMEKKKDRSKWFVLPPAPVFYWAFYKKASYYSVRELYSFKVHLIVQVPSILLGRSSLSQSEGIDSGAYITHLR